MFCEVPSWFQNCGTTSLAAKCQKSHVFFDILEQNVHQTLIFIEWIESRIKKDSGWGTGRGPMGFCTLGSENCNISWEVCDFSLPTWAAVATSPYIYRLKPIYIQQSWRLCFFRSVLRKLWSNTPARLRPAEAARRIRLRCALNRRAASDVYLTPGYCENMLCRMFCASQLHEERRVACNDLNVLGAGLSIDFHWFS